MGKIKKEFFKESAHLVAPKLLGLKLCSKECSAIISEVEAYEGKNDSASHALTLTPRSKIMYETYAHLYVYFVYGNHYCLNITCGESEAGAILIRELIPVSGIGLMKKRRGVSEEKNLCSGPGKLCQALGIDKSYNGLKLGEKLWIEKAASKETKGFQVLSLPRVGITKAMGKKWRFRLVEQKLK
ncbi:MAG: DNA-3-methyladenine glycosylase [archaeon]|jgi:DNA-3-methyladenine glycosylase